MPDKAAQPEVLISVQAVSKKFCRSLKYSLFYGLTDMLTELSGQQRRSHQLRPQEFWALREISFQLRRGEALGLVGANGAGKSTLLRILSGLIVPDTGSVTVRGRVAPLIALGAGFNPILTGRENIYANMAILGLTASQIRRRFDQVVAFAEIDQALDAPVQTYSSGMAARLGFACAVHTDPDVLLIDEVLAVGDLRFRMKCHRRLTQLRQQGTAFILVSHNSHSILNVCERSLYLKQGELVAADQTERVILQYEADLTQVQPLPSLSIATVASTAHTELSIQALYFRDEFGNLMETPRCGELLKFCIQCQVRVPLTQVNVVIKIGAQLGEYDWILHLNSAHDQVWFDLGEGTAEIQMVLPALGLVPGRYVARVYIRSGLLTYDIVESFLFTVEARQIVSHCLFYQDRAWQLAQDKMYTKDIAEQQR